MDSAWDQQPDSPEVKYEPTSVDSFLSPPPQFPSTSSTTPATDALAAYTLTPGLPDSEELSPAPEAEKKPVKKRKSWGQVLPEPKTNLPPRKRAKTEDEKEQRRVERVLRNRRAAQSSRERKRQEVEALERRTKDLEAMLLNAQRVNGILIAHIRNTEGSLPPDLTASKPLPTLSNSIFQSSTESLDNSVNDLASFQQETLTVDPASLSPIPEDPTTPVPEQSMSTPAPEFLAPPAASSVDLTQRPAVSVDGDAAVVAGNSEPESSDPFTSTMSGLDFLRHFDDAGASNTDSYFLENGMLSSPEPSLVADDDLVRDASFAPADLNFNEFLHDEFSRGWPDGAVGSLSSLADSDPLFGFPNLPEPEAQVS